MKTVTSAYNNAGNTIKELEGDPQCKFLMRTTADALGGILLSTAVILAPTGLGTLPAAAIGLFGVGLMAYVMECLKIRLTLRSD